MFVFPKSRLKGFVQKGQVDFDRVHENVFKRTPDLGCSLDPASDSVANAIGSGTSNYDRNSWLERCRSLVPVGLVAMHDTTFQFVAALSETNISAYMG